MYKRYGSEVRVIRSSELMCNPPQLSADQARPAELVRNKCPPSFSVSPRLGSCPNSYSLTSQVQLARRPRRFHPLAVAQSALFHHRHLCPYPQSPACRLCSVSFLHARVTAVVSLRGCNGCNPSSIMEPERWF